MDALRMDNIKEYNSENKMFAKEEIVVPCEKLPAFPSECMQAYAEIWQASYLTCITLRCFWTPQWEAGVAVPCAFHFLVQN